MVADEMAIIMIKNAVAWSPELAAVVAIKLAILSCITPST